MNTHYYIGIDEAGLGPTLGPLVHGWCGIASDLPEIELAMEEAFSLCRLIGIKPDDSKKLYSGANKKSKLDTCFAGLLSLLESTPRVFKDLNVDLLLNVSGKLDLYPPYKNLPMHPLPDYNSFVDNKLQGGVCTMFEGELNSCLADGFNKSSTAMLKIGKIIDLVLSDRKEESITFLIDKQGGRNFYIDFLSDIFPYTNIITEIEGDDLSQYFVESERRKIRFYFAKQGDSKYLLVSIASILAKWTRELYMESFNSYWTRYNSVAFTAGYPQDAKRFIQEMSAYFEKSEMPLDFIIRRK